MAARAYRRHAHCSYCGQAFERGQRWPRTCAGCGQTSFLNPLPVVVMLVPIAGGLLAVRRGIDPGRGQLALPGGYINQGETWQAAGAREVREETGLAIDPAGIHEFAVRSTPDGEYLLVFGLAEALAGQSLPPVAHDRPQEAYGPETLECVVLTQPARLAFPLHTAVVAEYFDRS